MKRLLLLFPLGVFLATVPGARPDDKEDLKGFTSLFPGDKLTGWKMHNGKLDFAFDNGVLYTTGQGHGWLMSEKEYGDFEIRLDYLVSKHGNSGVALRAPMQGDPAYSGMEIQILDDADYKGLRPTQYTGSIYDVVGPSKMVTKPAGQWNKMHIIAKGRQIVIEINGTKVVDADLDKYKDHAAKHPGLLRTKGHIGLQSHTGRVEFNNLYVKSLDGQKQ